MAKLTPEDNQLRIKIAERIAQLRTSTGLSQSEFAKQHDLDRQQLNRWENTKNTRGITIYTLHRFCNMLDITLNSFFDNDKFR